jgi:hypothetical protein
LRALLLHLEQAGFEGAPRYLGIDDDCDVLTFVEGDVPSPPYPAWSMTDSALAAMGRLLRRFHDATESFAASDHTGWSGNFADSAGGPVVCHNDTFPENVVFHAGVPVALIDFDEAGPGRPLWDLAITAQEWAPLKAPASRRDHPPDLDAVARLGVLAHAYGVSRDDADELVAATVTVLQRSTAHLRLAAEDGSQWAQDWLARGGAQRAVADEAWLAQHRGALVVAARG